MATIRVDYQGLRAVADQMRPLSDRLAIICQELSASRNAAPAVGEPNAAVAYDELLRQLASFLEIGVVTTRGLTRSLYAATGDYATADAIVMR